MKILKEAAILDDHKSMSYYCNIIATSKLFVLRATISNGSCTEWSAIWSEIKRVITKSQDREAVPTSVPIPRFPVPCFKDSRAICIHVDI